MGLVVPHICRITVLFLRVMVLEEILNNSAQNGPILDVDLPANNII